MFSCNPTKRVPEGEFLLSSNRVKTDNISLDKDELLTVLKQRPNRKILKTYRFYLHAYNAARVFKDSSRIRNWLETSVGEEPVLLDTTLAEKSASQLKILMRNKGYYNAEVLKTIAYKGKKAVVTYDIRSKRPYKINLYNYQIPDSMIRALVLANDDNSLIKYGNNFDVSILEAERERITNLLKTNGYYFFNKEFLVYKADTADFKVNLTLRLRGEDEINTSVLAKGARIYKQYTIGDINIDIGYDPRNPNKQNTDSLFFKGYRFNYSGRLKYKPEVILRSIFFQQGDYYSEKSVSDTYQSLSDLRSFRYTNIYFIPDLSDTITGNYLKAFVQLSPIVPKSYSVSTEGTNSSGNLGINGNLIYQNKNAFRGAQVLEMKLHGGLEVQKLFIDSKSGYSTGNEFLDKANIGKTFNTFEFSPQISYEIPKIWPFKTSLLPKKSSPHTTFLVAYNYQARPDFTRNLFNLSMSYTSKPFQKKEAFKNIRLQLFIPDINIISITKDPVFFHLLVDENNKNLLRSFTDVFISAIKASIIFNNQNVQKSNNFSYIRFDVEQAGLLLYNLSKYYHADTTSYGSYYFFKDIYGNGKPFAQYWKFDFDYRFYQIFNKKNSIAYRFLSGIALPGPNSNKVIPFQKSYFGGGANDIRAFPSRSLGPGGYFDKDAYARLGDIKLEGNIEYRFTIFKQLKGAWFTDFGNIWLYYKDDKRPDADFDPKKFHTQIAIGAGMGIRYDFDFFVIRFDLSTPLYDPKLPEGQRQIYKKDRAFSKEWRDAYKDSEIYNSSLINPTIGIGYPF